MNQQPIAALGGIEVETHEGDAIRLGDLVDGPTILIIPRYYGCMPCRDYLIEVSGRLDEVGRAGAGVLAVSSGAPHQARWLVEERGVRFPLLVDPERRVHEALTLPRRLSVALNPVGWRNYGRAIIRGNRQGKMVDPLQIPGLALLDYEANAVRVHRGRALGDYPPLDEVLGWLGELAGSALGSPHETVFSPAMRSR